MLPLVHHGRLWFCDQYRHGLNLIVGNPHIVFGGNRAVLCGLRSRKQYVAFIAEPAALDGGEASTAAFQASRATSASTTSFFPSAIRRRADSPIS
jgi:hypothetical protein